MKPILALALLTGLVAAPASAAGKRVPSLDIGNPFPVIDLPLADTPEASASIMSYRGRKLMLHLFASW